MIAVEEGCSHEEAIRRTVEIHNEQMHTFVAEAGALSLTGSPMLQRFFVDTWAWMGGSREWHATTGRYHARCRLRRRHHMSAGLGPASPTDAQRS